MTFHIVGTSSERKDGSAHQGGILHIILYHHLPVLSMHMALELSGIIEQPRTNLAFQPGPVVG